MQVRNTILISSQMDQFLDVVVVPFRAIRDGSLTPQSVHLSPSGETCLDAMPLSVAPDLRSEQVDVLRRSGRCPTNLTSPRSILMSCGSSSSEVCRMISPILVRRSTPSTPPGGLAPLRESVSTGPIAAGQSLMQHLAGLFSLFDNPDSAFSCDPSGLEFLCR